LAWLEVALAFENLRPGGLRCENMKKKIRINATLPWIMSEKMDINNHNGLKVKVRYKISVTWVLAIATHLDVSHTCSCIPTP
jgi:hypothetical protein